MPRIVPIKLLKCLKVLLGENGGILSAGEVTRLASLMTKYSKQLVSKCIYVQILKCTKTELLGEFMAAGGWSLVYTWLNDAIRAMNWPLVQEILELLLLCPVDVHRLKINSAPKLVKGLCKDGGSEGVRILAKRLVEQWLKVVTENPEATLSTAGIMPQAPVTKPPTVAVVAPEAISVNVQQQTSVASLKNQNTSSNVQQHLQQKQQEEQKTKINQQKLKSNKKSNKVQEIEQEEDGQEADDDMQKEEKTTEKEPDDQDPLGGVDPQPAVTNYTLTPAQKKASESGLVYKFIIKDGQSILAKVPPKPTKVISSPQAQSSVDEEDEEEEEEEPEAVSKGVAAEEADETEAPEDTVDNVAAMAEADENSSLDKTEKDNDSNSGLEEKTKMDDAKKPEDKILNEVEKASGQKDRRNSKEKERRGSSSSVEKDKDKDSKTSKSSSSSSSHRSSSSSHKSSSSSSKSSSSSSSKWKSSSHRSDKDRTSSSDKHRSDKERSSSSSKDKEKDRGSSSNSSKYKSSSLSSSSKSSSSSSSKEKYRDKEKTYPKGKEKQELPQTEKDKVFPEKVSFSSSMDKIGKIPKKPKKDLETPNESDSSSKHTSITIPSKKASMSIEIRKDTEKAKTVKTYKSQFRSHGLTEEAPPPPSRKGLKKPSSATPPGTVLPSSLPSSLKRSSPPPRDMPSEKKAKIDINNVTVANEKPGSIKLIPPKKIQTLVETNIFSEALSAATGPKKIAKRKRSNAPLVNGKEGPLSPTSPEPHKVAPLKFYQDTLDESKVDESKTNKENDEAAVKQQQVPVELAATDVEDDDDIPLKKVKEDIEQKVAKEKKLECVDNNVKMLEAIKDEDEQKQAAEGPSSPNREEQQHSPKVHDDEADIVVEKKPGPGCGPNGPPGVLMLHRRKGPKKKLTWRPQESLEQIRYFELDENERCNVTKNSFMDMKNLEHFNERDAIVMARRGFNHEDHMEAQTQWKPLIIVDDVPAHPEGSQSKQRKIQADRELTTLRALYFTHALIPDSPTEADFEPVFNQDVPLIPLDDISGITDPVSDFTNMRWPEPRGSPKQGDNSLSGTGGLGNPVNMFESPAAQVKSAPNNNKPVSSNNTYNPFVSPFASNQGTSVPILPPMQSSPPSQWQGPANSMVGPLVANGPIITKSFNGSPLMDMGGPAAMLNNAPPQNFMNQFSSNFVGPPNPFMSGPQNFNNAHNNFGHMGPNGPMMNNSMGPGPMVNKFQPQQMMNGGHNNRNNRGNNNGGNWRSGGSNFQDNSGGGGIWRPAGPGPNMRGGGMNNNGICKAYMRGHCRLGNSCKYIHPHKSKRI